MQRGHCRPASLFGLPWNDAWNPEAYETRRKSEGKGPPIRAIRGLNRSFKAAVPLNHGWDRICTDTEVSRNPRLPPGLTALQSRQ
jgi:hypothetical protein